MNYATNCLSFFICYCYHGTALPSQQTLAILMPDKRQAKVLGSGSGWEVLELLKESGVEGSTADEISERLDLPKSTVYNILSDLSCCSLC